MGTYLNPGNSGFISRPRRFGKSYAAIMIIDEWDAPAGKRKHEWVIERYG